MKKRNYQAPKIELVSRAKDVVTSSVEPQKEGWQSDFFEWSNPTIQA